MQQEVFQNDRTLQKQLLSLLASELQGGKETAEGNAIWTLDSLRKLYSLSKHHDLAHIVSAALTRQAIDVPQELAESFQREEALAFFRQVKLDAAFAEICRILEAEQIVYIPLKGAVLRPYYPDPSMRTSCDVDILVHEEDLERACAALTAQGYRKEPRSYHDISLYSRENVHLELHFSLMEAYAPLDRVLRRAWDYAVPCDGYRHVFSPEFFVFHMLAHMSHHIMSGGCGARSLLDLWVMEHRMQMPYTVAESLLREAGILVFAERMHALVACCFAEAAVTEESARLLAYIMGGGTYGTQKNHAAVKHTKQGSLSYLRSRVFPPYRQMAPQYPALQKHPVLLPAFWCLRLVQKLREGKGSSAQKEWSAFQNVTEEQCDEVRRIHAYLGLP